MRITLDVALSTSGNDDDDDDRCESCRSEIEDFLLVLVTPELDEEERFCSWECLAHHAIRVATVAIEPGDVASTWVIEYGEGEGEGALELTQRAKDILILDEYEDEGDQ